MSRSLSFRLRPRVYSKLRRSSSVRTRRFSSLKIKPRLRTRTKTKTAIITKRKRRLNTRVRPDGPMSHSAFHFPPRVATFKLGVLKKTLAPQFLVSNGSLKLTTLVGYQDFVWNDSAYSIPTWGSYADMTSIFAQASSLAPSSVNTKTQKLYLKRITGELMITNQTNDVINCKLYDVVARRDINNAGMWSPGRSWIQGCTDTGSSTAAFVVGSNPFQSPVFTHMFKVEKVTDVDIHTGGHHVHKISCKFNHEMSDEILQQLNNNFSAIGGITRFTMPIIHGYPVNDVTQSTQCSTASVGAAMVWRKQIEYYQTEKDTSSIAVSDSLSKTITPAFISDLTGSTSLDLRV